MMYCEVMEASVGVAKNMEVKGGVNKVCDSIVKGFGGPGQRRIKRMRLALKRFFQMRCHCYGNAEKDGIRDILYSISHLGGDRSGLHGCPYLA